jgi:predicted RND superfamily exporter protein
MRTLADQILKYRIPILLACLLLCVPALYSVSRMEAEEAFDSWYGSDDPVYKQYQDLEDQFGSGRFFVAVFKDDDLFTSEHLRLISNLTARLEQEKGVEKVTSLTNVEYVYGQDDTLVVEPLVRKIPYSSDGLSEIRRKALEKTLYRNTLISRDGTTTAILVDLHDIDTVQESEAVVNNASRIIREVEIETGKKVFLGGLGFIDAAIRRASVEDFATFFPVALVMIFLILSVTFRLLAPAVLSILVVSLALLFTLALYAAGGQKFNMMTPLLPMLLLTIGVAESVHILVHYYFEELSSCLTREEALRQTVEKMFRPCFFTSLTTAVGFASFVVSSVPITRVTGLYAALGIIIIFALSIVVLPAALSFLPAPRGWKQKAAQGVSTKGLQQLTLFTLRFRRGILIGALVLTVPAAYGSLHVSSESTFIRLLRPSNPVREVYEFIEANMIGQSNLEILVETAPDGLKDPDLLRRVDRLQEFISQRPYVTKTISVVDLLRDMNRALHDGDPAHDAIPPTRQGVAQTLLLYEMSGGDGLRHYVTGDYALGRVTVFFKSASIQILAELEDEILTHAQEELDLPVQVTGTLAIFKDGAQKLTNSQIRSLVAAFVAITLLIMLFLRSVRLGLISMIPNIIPVFLLFSTMGWAGIDLDVATVMVAGMALGIGVNDTIHYMTRFRRELEECGDYEATVRLCGTTVARAMVTTSAILFTGFIVLSMGNSQAIANLGLLSSVTMLYALVGDLFLLPALLLALKPLSVRGGNGSNLEPSGISRFPPSGT